MQMTGHFVREVEERNVLERAEPFACCLGIARRGFIEHKLGDVEVEVGAASAPPFLGHLLVTGANQIAAWPSRQVAGHRGFDVELRFQRRQPVSFRGRKQDCTTRLKDEILPADSKTARRC